MTFNIRKTILEGIRDPNDPIYIKNKGLLKDQLDLESRIEMTISYAQEHKIELDNVISKLQSNLEAVNSDSDPIDKLLSLELNQPAECLLEKVFIAMKDTTIKYSKAIREQQVDKQNAINRTISELSLIVDDANNAKKIADLEQELTKMRDEILQDEASVHRSFHLLKDCKVTPAFLNLEKRKAGYSNICKITTENGIITDPNKIRNETAKFYQKIYNKQKVKSSVDDIKNFWNPIMIT